MTDAPELLAQTADEFAQKLAAVQSRIEAAARAAGRDASDVRLLPVSKTVPEDRLRHAVAAGMTTLGENKPQEAKRKWQNLSDLGVNWAVIGHLQRNKAKDVAEFASEFQALDSERLAETLQRRLDMVDRRLDIYVQVNTSNEDQKFGLSPEEVPAFLDRLPDYDRLNMRGFMTLAVFSDDQDRVRACFEVLRDVRDAARRSHGDVIGAGELSMGMSGDFELAIAEGSNVVRVGQAIFGKRATPDSQYWPQ